MANPGMVRWNLLVSQTVIPEPTGTVTVDAAQGEFDHSQLPDIIQRVENMKDLAEGVRAFTAIMEMLTAFMAPLIAEKRTLDKWL